MEALFDMNGTFDHVVCNAQYIYISPGWNFEKYKNKTNSGGFSRDLQNVRCFAKEILF